MSNIIKVWENERIAYQQRYFKYLKKYKEDETNKENLGHLHECSYVLINVFGLTQRQVEELEQCGLTNKDLQD